MRTMNLKMELNFSMFKKLKKAYRRLFFEIRQNNELLETLVQSTLSSELDALKSAGRRRDNKNIAYHSYQHLSQSDEDGIIKTIFHTLGIRTGQFIEIGVGDGLQNNTASLLYQGWVGLWVEGSESFSKKIFTTYQQAIENKTLQLRNSFVTKDNILDLIVDVEGSVDLLSIDIDGNDFAILTMLLTEVQPKVIVAEYNAKFGPEVHYCMRYDEKHIWKEGIDKTDKFGVSYAYLKNGLKEKGYTIVTCNLAGTNAFFIRNDLISNVSEIMPRLDVFQPARYHLTKLKNGHSHGPKTYESSL